MIEPDFIYDQDDWEITLEWRDRSDLTDDTLRPRLGEWRRYATLVHGPDKFAAYVLKQDARHEDEVELRWFDSEDEARRACELRPATLE